MKKATWQLIFFLLLFVSVAIVKEFHVSVKGSDKYSGTAAKPFRTINHVAQLAQPGDVITVHAGTHLEWINPKRGGTGDNNRIVYRAAAGEKVEIKGSEIIAGWLEENGGVWKVVLPNSCIGTYNPCADLVFEDRCDNIEKSHAADVFLNGKSFYETDKKENVTNPVPYEKSRDKEGSTYTWFYQEGVVNRTIWANFHNSNPNKQLVELSIRRTCFYPDKPGINYLTISGFDFSQAATQWGAPIAEHIGMISTHWNKGWIMEKNRIHDSKGSGITLGKERCTGHNVWSNDPSYDGSIHYIEFVFKTLRNGWNKEHIGSHIVRNNEIFNREQTGIGGSMGAAFSIIENNHIYKIHQKNQFTGAELAGIKIHAAIDTRVEKNRIHDVGALGCWFDWMAQGTRISKNVLYRNNWQDLFLEVNHGPFLVDNNILLSEQGLATQSEGGAFIHNLITGQMAIWSDPNWFTPYHRPHSTDVAGLAPVLTGDDQYYNNIFIGGGKTVKSEDSLKYGLRVFIKEPDLSAWGTKKVNTPDKLPFWMNNNVYYNGALPYDKETNFSKKTNFNPYVVIIEEENKVYLEFLVDESFINHKTQVITTSRLGKVKMAREAFENPDSTALIIDTDFFGKKRSKQIPRQGLLRNRVRTGLN